MTSSSVASALSTSRVFTTRGISRSSTAPAPARRGASADPSRSLVTARVVPARPPYSGEPILFRFGDDGEPVAAETSSLASFENAASERESWDFVDDAGAESAVEVLRGPDGNLLFRFTGDAREEFEAAAAQADQPIAGDRPAEMTPVQKAQALLDEAAALIERAKAIQNGDESDLAAAAKAAAETLADPNLDGTVIMRRPAKPAALERSDPAGAIARVSQLGIKAVVDGIENMFSNFRKTPVARKVQQVTNPVRLPKAPKDSPWVGKTGAANVSVDAAFDTFGADADAAGDGFLYVADAADPEAALAEAVEEEHAAWETQAARALEKGSVEALESRPEEGLELASERYGDMGSVVAGLWRPKPVDVTIGGREFVAYITPNNLKQLPSGEYVVSDDEEEGEGVPGDRVGEETTIILAEKQPDGTNVFMFGLTRTVLADGSVLYRFPSGETLG
jgi:hypothetical protein